MFHPVPSLQLAHDCMNFTRWPNIAIILSLLFCFVQAEAEGEAPAEGAAEEADEDGVPSVQMLVKLGELN